ncbi:hypothetical protein LIA77_05885 [Sarocladium implicatum]|nr:hypothetical protein LIA77_05885 [Sarocladium implicatum]
MAAASISTEGFGQGLVHHQKLTKSRNRTVVKPILKKLHSATSDDTSLDLDRGWDEQPIHYYDPSAENISSRGSARDVSFSYAGSNASSYTPSGMNGADSASRRRNANPTDKYSHARSTSGASHASITTTGSGRNGTFVHPFQQTPRTSEPPLAQPFSSAPQTRPSLDMGYGLGLRDIDRTSTIDEHNDGTEEPVYSSVTATPTAITPSSAISVRYPQHGLADSRSITNGRPSYHRHNRSSSTSGGPYSLAGQRTNSLSDVASTQSAPRFSSVDCSIQPSATRLPALTNGRPEFYPSSVSSGVDSPLSSTVPTPYKDSPTSPPTLATAYSSPATGGTPIMSPLRSSLDMGGFRLRSRSSLDTASRSEQVRQARRKFEEKEKAKEEKYAREQTKKRERADTKEAQRQLRKGSTSGLASSRTSSSTEIRPTISRRNTEPVGVIGEKDNDPFGQGYDSVRRGDRPTAKADDVTFTPAPRRSKTAKRKTTADMAEWSSTVKKDIGKKFKKERPSAAQAGKFSNDDIKLRQLARAHCRG